jgi:hypothetical protein
MSLQGYTINNAEVWVVFTGQTDMRWLKWLRPGFRHCYIIMNDGARWISVDPLSNYMDVTVHHNVPVHFDLPLWLKDRGHIVLQSPVMRPECEAPWMPFTCVEAVKRMLGIHHRFIYTPWQLYRHIQKLSSYPSNQGEPTWEVCLHAPR